MNQDPSPIIKALLLSNDSIRWRIDEMSGHIDDVRIQRLKTTNFSIQTDESTVIDNKALLMGYVRYFDGNCALQEDLLFVKLLETDTTDTSMFSAVKTFFEEKEIPHYENLVSCATDGAVSMVGRHKRFISH
ncbi:zinc finger MYM-type protein 6-like [Octopus sinensis]|uniref:Zinc finger MYM-type protein 6-like n=1 Tax=Octopus sinensis TaxID=2607531 RepID=A0A6P7SHQ7_9MOLL|nr:zinc finger MYM-type protein 6-like [Octopus sinensis]